MKKRRILLISSILFLLIVFFRSQVKTKSKFIIPTITSTPIPTETPTPTPTISLTPTLIPTSTSTPTPTPRKMILIPLTLGYTVNCYENKVEEVKKTNNNLIEADQKYNSCVSSFVANPSDCDNKCDRDNNSCWDECEKVFYTSEWDNCTNNCTRTWGNCIGYCIAERKKQKSEYENKCSETFIKPVYDNLLKVVGNYCEK